MWRFLVLAFLIATNFGCSRYVKTAFVDGHLNVVIRSHEAQYEDSAWRFVLKRYGELQKPVVRPQAVSDKLDFIQLSFETLEMERRRRVAVRTNTPVDNSKIPEVRGFFVPKSNIVFYVTGEFGTLAHEYCHSLNYQLDLGLTHEQDEYLCSQIKEDYEGNLKMQRLQRENRNLRREINSRRLR